MPNGDLHGRLATFERTIASLLAKEKSMPTVGTHRQEWLKTKREITRIARNAASLRRIVAMLDGDEAWNAAGEAMSAEQEAEWTAFEARVRADRTARGKRRRFRVIDGGKGHDGHR